MGKECKSFLLPGVGVDGEAGGEDHEFPGDATGESISNGRIIGGFLMGMAWPTLRAPFSPVSKSP
jgi:hypothetical protein